MVAGVDDPDHAEFVSEPDVLKYFITPAFFTSFLAALLSPYLLSPPLWRLLLPPNKRPSSTNMYFHTMLSSTVHAFVSFSFSIYLMGFGLMGTNRIYSRLPLGFTAMQISLGYFCGDFVVCLLDPKLRSDMGSILHHLAGIVGLSLSLLYQGLGMFFVVYRLVAEASTPFVNLRYILSTLGEKDKSLYLFTGWSMLISFLLCRIIVIPWHWYEILTTVLSEECARLVPMFFRVWLGFNYLVFDILNIYWFGKIVRGAFKLYRTKTRKS